MPLPFKVESLDKIPEAQRSLYTEGDDGTFTLDVDGVEDVSGLKSALAKVKRELADAKKNAGKLSDDDVTELEQLRADKAAADEAKAREAGKFDELRTKLQEKHDKELAGLRTQIERRDGVIKKLTVTNEVRSAIAAAGVLDEYRPAVEALLMQQSPDVLWEDGKDPVGVFRDEVEGDRPIGAFVTAWAKSDAASPYMPPENGGGGGAGGGKPPKGGRPSWEGKKYSEMTPDEKVAYTTQKHAEGAYQPSTAA